MNLCIRLVLLLGFTIASQVSAEDAVKQMEKETLGKLRINMPEKTLIELMGKPQSKGKQEMWEAIGERVQSWNYPAQGLQFNMSGSPKTILSMTAQAPCKLATSRGIGIGSSEADVLKAYRSFEDKENSQRGKIFVAGSIYGGVTFHFDHGKVRQIFFGAAAE
jgi:hypothetical protein